MDPVLDLLNKKRLQFKVSGKDYVIRCLNPQHDDSNPSFRIDKVTGAAHCFSCGFKTNIFKFYGLSNNIVSIKVVRLKEKLKDVVASMLGVEFPLEKIPVTMSFRGISVKTLKKFNAFYCYGDEKLDDRIFFPIVDMTGKTVCYIGRHTLSDVNPKYRIYPAHVSVPIYPEVHEVQTKSVVLVEGIFDMLNLHDKGLLYASCVFGTNTLQKDTSSKLLPFKSVGVEKVYILFDGDNPGREAAKTLKPLVEECGFYCEIIKLEDGKDPGDLTKDEVDSINEYINPNTP